MPRLLVYAWTAPTSLLGLVAGALALASGGQGQRVGRIIEFHGGFATWLAKRVGFAAMTLGHVIIGHDPWSLMLCRDHELAHVRQAERWGPFFIPAYFAAGLWAWARTGSAYYENWFERDARRACGDN